MDTIKRGTCPDGRLAWISFGVGGWGDAVARHLGSPKAIDRMTAYLNCEKPTDADTVVDEMLAIRAEIDAWKRKKTAEESNNAYNDLLYYGLGEEAETDEY